MQDPNHRSIDPEPVSLALVILGAIGSIASIVSLIDQRRSPTRKVEAERQVMRDATGRLEAALRGLKGSTRGFQAICQSSTIEWSEAATGGIGAVRVVMSEENHQEWFHLQQDIVASITTLNESLFHIQAALADNDRRIPSTVAEKLKDAVHQMNVMLRELPSMHPLDILSDLEDRTEQQFRSIISPALCSSVRR